jgi:large subunit ribosomal protein L25
MEIKLKAKKREILGKKVSQLRRKGIVPGVIYGHDFKNIPLEIDLHSFTSVLKEAGETTIIDLEIEGVGSENVLINDITREPVTGEILHIDFYRTKADEAMVVDIPLVFEGISSAVKDLGGILVTSLKNIKVKALPKNLPHSISVDVTSLKNIDEQIRVSDIPKMAGVEFLSEDGEVVASIEARRSKEEIEALSGEVKEEVDKVEGVADAKEEEGDAEATDKAD